MKIDGFPGASDHAPEGSRSSESSSQHFALASKFDAKSDAKTLPESMKNRGKRLPGTPSKIVWKFHGQKLGKVSQKAPENEPKGGPGTSKKGGISGYLKDRDPGTVPDLVLVRFWWDFGGHLVRF